MARAALDGRDIRLVLSWLTNQNVLESDIAAALQMPATTYSGHKEKPEYPSFAELALLAGHYNLSARVLQLWWGDRQLDELQMLDNNELRQWLMLGGGNHPAPPLAVTWRGKTVGRRNYTLARDDDGL